MIAPSFADIFYNNCFKNGILPIALPQAEIDKLMDDAERGSNAVISVDLEKQEIRGPDGGCIKFDDRSVPQAVPAEWLGRYRPDLRNEKKISDFEARRKRKRLGFNELRPACGGGCPKGRRGMTHDLQNSPHCPATASAPK